jgi:hypothetical protein
MRLSQSWIFFSTPCPWQSSELLSLQALPRQMGQPRDKYEQNSRRLQSDQWQNIASKSCPSWPSYSDFRPAACPVFTLRPGRTSSPWHRNRDRHEHGGRAQALAVTRARPFLTTRYPMHAQSNTCSLANIQAMVCGKHPIFFSTIDNSSRY